VFLLYDALVGLAVALFLRPHAWLRGARGELRQRLGEPPAPAAHPRIVLHAVSAGEMAAAGAIVESLGDVLSSAAVHLTTGNRDGLAAGERLRDRFPSIVSVSFLPWDRRRAIRNWLAAVDPDAVAVVETEIWPNLFRTCAISGIPLLIVNGRVPDRDYPRYRVARLFFRRVLAGARVAARSPEDARRFVRIGAPSENVRVAGNVKFDAARADSDGRTESTAPVVVAGSTHPPEERLLLSAFLRLRREFPGLTLVLAPRRVGRGPAILRRARAAGLRAAAASAGASSSPEVLVVDVIGGLRGRYVEGEIAVVGGTFSRRGGHTPLEAAARGCAVVSGPRTGNFREILVDMRSAGAAAIVAPRGLETALRELLGDPARRAELGRRGRAFAESGRGAARRCAEEIAAVVAERGSPPVSGQEAGEAFLPSDSEDTGT
jgi:3-deoxy-D-manno-octulosonic-acid transferase